MLKDKYNKVKKTCDKDYGSADTGKKILELVTFSLKFLTTKCDLIQLNSKVQGKQYCTFKKGNTVARPANSDLFLNDPSQLKELWQQWLSGKIDKDGFAKLSYTSALAPCLAMEIFDRQNKKGPATYFECYIGHIFAKSYKVNPTKKASLPVCGKDVKLTMDFLIEIDKNRRKIHLPVKMSTRERVVQAWAHQRLLDKAYGEGIYSGVMVLFAETKLDSRTHEVIEICVPDQWLSYQSLLAKMERIYYFDMPDRYQSLTEEYPDTIVIKQFGEFFTEKDLIVRR